MFGLCSFYTELQVPTSDLFCSLFLRGTFSGAFNLRFIEFSATEWWHFRVLSFTGGVARGLLTPLHLHPRFFFSEGGGKLRGMGASIWGRFWFACGCVGYLSLTAGEPPRIPRPCSRGLV